MWRFDFGILLQELESDDLIIVQFLNSLTVVSFDSAIDSKHCDCRLVAELPGRHGPPSRLMLVPRSINHL